MKEADQPPRPDIEATIRPFEHGVLLGRHPDGALTLRVSGEFVLKVNPQHPPAASPQDAWRAPIVEIYRDDPQRRLIDASRQALSLWESGNGQDTEVCDAMMVLRERLDAHDRPAPPFIPELEEEPQDPEPVRFRALTLDHGYYKCFVPEREGDGEDGAFFLRLDETSGEGEISMADPRDSLNLLQAFARAFTDDNERFYPEPEGNKKP